MTCDIRNFRGWRCTRDDSHKGPCALRPAWWNIPARLRFSGWL